MAREARIIEGEELAQRYPPQELQRICEASEENAMPALIEEEVP
jgi:hypothetical protein